MVIEKISAKYCYLDVCKEKRPAEWWQLGLECEYVGGSAVSNFGRWKHANRCTCVDEKTYSADLVGNVNTTASFVTANDCRQRRWPRAFPGTESKLHGGMHFRALLPKRRW
ncbi:hypothetical protein M513_00021 [Trichuris suis]|uniref:Uncharacterized protein n=1 Tax=Trichuris suis TaxID=68888 RepID=A0A085LLJ8_9BILA|nr:hypothetical protein M513_13278 [Trichuris suis]KFD58858.1 hypothetical protein M513_00021 [Trichuris suis]